MTPFSVSSLYQWPRHSSPKAREIVLNIINTSKAPLATKDIYKLAVKPSETSSPPHANEEIRSMRYLKTVVLRDLSAQRRVEKVRTQGAFTAWLWRPSAARACKVTSIAAAVPLSLSPTAAVGVGEDWGHLNKRRQRARKAKVERDVQRVVQSGR